MLLVGVVAMSAAWWMPRVRAAWRLHDASTQSADYAVCMAGPTGAVLLRDEPAKFWQLVRRRIVAAGGEERPLAACSSLARELTGSEHVALLHEALARDYASWGAKRGKIELSELASELPSLTELAQKGWPFVRGGAAVLMKPSLGAKEAVYPMAAAQPGYLRGLAFGSGLYRARRVNERGWYVVTTNGQETRAYRSRDSGHTWTGTSPWQAALQGTANRCTSDSSELGFAVEPLAGEGVTAVKYYEQDLRTGQSKVPRPFRALKALACDESAALLLTAAANSQWELWLCQTDQACRQLPSPAALQGLALDGIDIARHKGATIVAVTQGSLVRVLSSRDDGRSYTPFTIAVDRAELEATAARALRPAQLLAIANSLLLIQEPVAGSGASLAVVSIDQGASWHSWGPAALHAPSM